MVVCQISRGMAPVMSIAEAQGYAMEHGAAYWLIAGFPAVEAKNIAVIRALSSWADLLLIEDDILAPRPVWSDACAEGSATVRVAPTRCRNGAPNTKYRPDGGVLCSGTAFVVIPYATLLRLPEPYFQAFEFRLIDGKLHPQGPNARGEGSDIWFWYQLGQLTPRPIVQVIGEVTALNHPLNRNPKDLRTPCLIEAT
jgi:hypothetical protein